MQLYIKKFDELTINELYEVLYLRNEIFIVEQNCSYLDIDYKDQNSIHVFTKKYDEITSYLRIILNKDIVFIGRVLVKNTYRGKSLSKKLMSKSINYIFDNYNYNKIKIEAQVYLEDFYTDIGFIRTSKDYLLDNIPHFMMEIDRRNF